MDSKQFNRVLSNGEAGRLPRNTLREERDWLRERIAVLGAERRELEKENHMLKRMREKYDCRFAGDYVEVSGKHCPIGEPCVRCQLEALAKIDAQRSDD